MQLKCLGIDDNPFKSFSMSFDGQNQNVVCSTTKNKTSLYTYLTDYRDILVTRKKCTETKAKEKPNAINAQLFELDCIHLLIVFR